MQRAAGNMEKINSQVHINVILCFQIDRPWQRAEGSRSSLFAIPSAPFSHISQRKASLFEFQDDNSKYFGCPKI